MASSTAGPGHWAEKNGCCVSLLTNFECLEAQELSRATVSSFSKKQERKMVDIAFGTRKGSDKPTLTLNPTWAKMAFKVVREWWRRHHSRRELASLSYHERDDLGAGRVNAEIAKPFWTE